MGVHENLTGAERAARRRAKLRAQGLRPLELWVPDLRKPEVRAGIERQVAAINRAMAGEDLAFAAAAAAGSDAALPPYDWKDEAETPAR